MGGNKLTKTLYLIFGDVRHQQDEDLEDICQNIMYFDNNCEIIINHPTSNHPKVVLRHWVQPVNQSSFIFGVFTEFLNNTYCKTIKFDHLCLFAANQYMINRFFPLSGVNYLQYYNTPNWDFDYDGKNFSNITIGNPLIQYQTFNWDLDNLHQKLDIPTPMVSNWEFAHLTKEAVDLCYRFIQECQHIYPTRDCIQLFPGYMALKTEQPWFFPPFFGTFDPSNRANNHNWIITEQQIQQKHNEGYCSVKRVNYTKNCPLKQFIRENYQQ